MSIGVIGRLKAVKSDGAANRSGSMAGFTVDLLEGLAIELASV